MIGKLAKPCDVSFGLFEFSFLIEQFDQSFKDSDIVDRKPHSGLIGFDRLGRLLHLFAKCTAKYVQVGPFGTHFFDLLNEFEYRCEIGAFIEQGLDQQSACFGVSPSGSFLSFKFAESQLGRLQNAIPKLHLRKRLRFLLLRNVPGILWETQQVFTQVAHHRKTTTGCVEHFLNAIGKRLVDRQKSDDELIESNIRWEILKPFHEIIDRFADLSRVGQLGCLLEVEI